MCITCRGREYSHTEEELLPVLDDQSESPASRLEDALHTPVSRARLLKVAGGSLALALAAGPLGRAAEAASSRLPYLVLIVLDGARPEYFSVPGIPTISSLLRNGTQYTNAFAGILESETPSGHVAIATGSEPRSNGILSFSWANGNVRVSLFDPDKVRAGAMEQIIRQSKVPTLAGQVHATHPKALVVALSGSKYYAADAIGGPDANIIMYFRGMANGQFAPTYIPGHAPPADVLASPSLVTASTHMPLGIENHLAMQLAVDTFKRTHQKVTLINLPEFDWPLGHVDGGIRAPQAINTLMQSFDRDLAMLQEVYRKKRVLHRTIFVLMADHGMMPLEHKVAAPDLARAVKKAGTSIVSQSSSTATYLWLKDKSRAAAAAQNIAALRNPYIQSVYVQARTAKGFAYSRATASPLLRAAGAEAANQYLLRSFAGPNGPDLVVFFTEHVGSEPGGQAGWKADHGGASWQAQHIPLILSGPGIRSGYVSPSPARLIDVAPTVLQLMGLSHKGMQGIPLADAMQAPPSWTVQWQKAMIKRVLPVVEGLQQQSRLELAAKR